MRSKMMKRIITNLILAFIFFPVPKLISDYITIAIKNDNSVYSGSFIEYEKLIFSTTFLLAPMFFLIFVLLPYNIVVIKYKPRLVIKMCLFEFILIIVFCMLGTFINVWSYPYWKNIYYLFYFIPYSIVFASVLHFLVDKKEK
jgi:hypothetical protein